MADAPLVTEHLCEPCRTHFAEVERLLHAAEVSFRVNPRLVRGLDYYGRTAFEVVAGNLGAQNAVGGGGRYDGLVAALGGPPLAGIGFAVGIERLLMATEGDAPDSYPEVDVIPLTSEASAVALRLTRRLRALGMRCELEAAGRSLKSAMRRADKLEARFAVLIGDDELRAGRATVRDLKRQTDHRLALSVDDPGPVLAETLRTLTATGGQGG
jgi:histidyl-tRNA synthetase